MEQKQQVLQWLEDHKTDLQRLLSDMIRIPSYSGEEFEVQQFVRSYAEEAGFEVISRAFDEKQKRPCVLITYRGNGDGKTLLLDAHSDTVKVQPYEKWDRDPFSGEFDGTWIHGRGSGDDKWGIAAAMMAMNALKACDVQLSGDVSLLSSVGEEAGKEDRARHGAGAMVASMEKKPDFCIICEGSNMEICPETPCSITLKIKIRGKANHFCLRHVCVFPQPHTVWGRGSKGGVDALQKAMLVIDALYRLERDLSLNHDRGGLKGAGGTDTLNRMGVGAFTICPVGIEGGTNNSIIGEVNVTYRVQCPSCYTSEEVLNIIRETVEGVAMSDLWLRDNLPEIEVSVQNRGFSSDASHPAIGIMQDACADVLGKRGAVSCWIAGCDGDVINPYTPCAVFGPQPPNTHAANERITLSEVLDCAKVFALSAMEFCK
ncbi:MAG: M20/M25/M40 family metallo-hydrolase [Clostridia bacterium]|nr:M20/M25/M40 family metallo-hydrolase [Clostridia bacterium]